MAMPYRLVRGPLPPRVFDPVTLSWRFWDEGKHPRGKPDNKGQFAEKNQGTAGGAAEPEPQGQPVGGPKGGQAAPVTNLAAPESNPLVLKGRSIVQRAKEIIDYLQFGRYLRRTVDKAYGWLVNRYGKKTATAIVASGHLLSWAATGVGAAIGVPLPFPSVVAMAPAAALAELHYRLKGKPVDDEGAEKPLTPEQKDAEVQRLLKHVEKATKAKAEHVTQKPEFRAWFGKSKVVDDEGDPAETASAAGVREENGKPKMVFHGSPHGEFHEFKKEMIANPDDLHFGPGFYFTENVKEAEGFAKGGHSAQAKGDKPTVMTYYLRAEKPFDVDKHTIDPRKLPEEERKLVRATVVQKAFSEGGRDEAIEAGHAFDDGAHALSYKELTSDKGVGGLGMSKVSVQKMLQADGYDSITTKAPSSESGKDRWWIVFEPEQVKETTAEKFDPNDRRTNLSLGQMKDYRFGVSCPHCGSDKTSGSRTIEHGPGGSWSYANTHCAGCGNGFSVGHDGTVTTLKTNPDRNRAKPTTLSTGTFDASKHPRGQPENAGEFAPKGAGQTSGNIGKHPGTSEMVAEEPDLTALSDDWYMAQKNRHVTPQKRSWIADGLKKALEMMTPLMRRKALANMNGEPQFYETIQDVTEEADRLAGREQTGKNLDHTVGGWFGLVRQTGKGELHVDWSHPNLMYLSPTVDNPETGVIFLYAHELAHAADGVDEFSGTPEWKSAYAEEIDLPDAPLTKNSTSGAHGDDQYVGAFEGFADFMATALVAPREAEERFPKCWAYCVAKGLVEQ